MEAARYLNPGKGGEPDPSSEPPAGIRAEIIVDLDMIYEPAAEIDQPEPEIVLTGDRVGTGLLYYLAQKTKPKQWYEGSSSGFGTVQSIYQDVGLRPPLTRKAITQLVENGLLKVRFTATNTGQLPDALLITKQGRVDVAQREAENPQEIELIKDSFKQHKRKTIDSLRNEVESERRHLGATEGYNFTDILSFETWQKLGDHIDWLREVQADLLFMIDHDQPPAMAKNASRK